MNFLVTGGVGFIGSHMCERLLHAGQAVWAFDDLNESNDSQFHLGARTGSRAINLKWTLDRGDIS
jgi:UDP-glucose 4-epimerase